jgi:hypothetical protein
MPLSQVTLRRWMRLATSDQKKALAKAAKTSVPHLNHITSGRRGVKPELAQRLAAASRTLGRRALYLDQRELCHDCNVCPIVDHPTAAEPRQVKPKRSTQVA